MAASGPAWLVLQRTIFTRYCSQKLAEAGKPPLAKELIPSLAEGVAFFDLIEALSGKEFSGGKRPAAPVTARIRQVDMLGSALAFVKEVGVVQKGAPTQPEDFVDGNEKAVFGLLFQVILSFLKFEDDDDAEQAAASGGVKEALLLWISNKVAGYEGAGMTGFQGVKAKALHNGMVLCALLHKMRPNLIDMSTVTPENGPANLELALSVFESACGLERYLSPADFPKLDELSAVVVMSDVYNSIVLLQKQDIAARRIGALASMTELHDKMRADYTAQATELRDWVDAKIAELNDRTFDDTMAGIKALLEAFYDFKANEKAGKIAAHVDLAGLFNALALRLHNAKRPAWVPPAGLELAALDTKFDSDLATAEAARSVALHEELARQIRLDRQATRLRSDAANMTSAAEGWESTCAGLGADIDSVEDAEYALEELERLTVDVTHAQTTRLAQLKKSAAGLYEERYEFSSDIQGLEAAVEAAFAQLTGTSLPQKKAALEAAKAEQEAINERVCRAMADAVEAFTGFLDAEKATLATNSGGTELEELEAALAAIQAAQAGHGKGDELLAAVNTASDAVAERRLAANPFTTLTFGDCSALLAQTRVLFDKKIALLQETIASKQTGGLTEEQTAEIDANFKFFDRNASGSLDRRELRACLTSLGETSTPARVDEILAEYDTDKNGMLTLDEFSKFMQTVLGDADTIEEIKEGWKNLAVGKPITTEVLSNFVNNVSFRDHHVEYLGREMPEGSDGGKDTEKWTDDVFAR